MRKRLLASVVCLCWALSVKAGDKTLLVKWPDLAPHVNGMNIRTVLADGTRVEGRAISVEPAGLSVIVAKSSGRAQLAGNSLLPRNAVASVRVRRTGWKWKVICPLVGFVAMGTLGGVVGGRVDRGALILSNGAAAGILAGMATGAGGGVLVGRWADHHDTTIKIAP